MSDTSARGTRMPVLFLGHGDPMNALRDNEFTRSLGRLGSSLPARPRSVLVVSAHWLTRGSFVCSAARPETIHDFYGFPDELYRVEYPAPGDPEGAERVAALLPGTRATGEWGLDHGAWTVLRHLLPEADLPCFQLSVDLAAPLGRMLELGAALAPLREEGYLVLGSGNIVHNLRRIEWGAPGFPWAESFDRWVRERLDAGGRRSAELADLGPAGEEGRLAVPTLDHYAPLLYALGAAGGPEAPAPSYPYEGLEHGSLSMRCALWP